jgi:hypothetical protein
MAKPYKNQARNWLKIQLDFFAPQWKMRLNLVETLPDKLYKLYNLRITENM